MWSGVLAGIRVRRLLEVATKVLGRDKTSRVQEKFKNTIDLVYCKISQTVGLYLHQLTRQTSFLAQSGCYCDGQFTNVVIQATRSAALDSVMASSSADMIPLFRGIQL